MKLSEKIQEALRQQQEINLSDPAVQKRLAAQWGYVPADAQPAPSFADAYQGAMEDVAIWKKRALEAEDLNRKFVAEINGPAYMGEPAQPAPSVQNTMLLTAAHGLLEALKRCKFDSLNMTLEDREFCRAAIAKATGEQP